MMEPPPPAATETGAACGPGVPAGLAPGPVDFCPGALDLRRMAQIANAKPTDHAGEVVIVPQKNFDLDKTIFASIESGLRRRVVAGKVGITLFWNDAATHRIRNAFAKIPPAPRYDQPLVEFIQNECDFAVEHA